MFLIPLVETTEPRYAEIARIMAESGDWITPWFNYGTPFWGKPPLSFWSQAAAIRVLGINEFAVRLPSLLATVATCVIIFHAARLLAGRNTALLSVLIYFTSASGYLLSGAVLTDPFLTLATTLAFFSALKLWRDPHCAVIWRYMLFAALGFGLLAKGPVALVLAGVPLGIWLTLNWKPGFRVIPWFTGFALMLLIALPWYIAAEFKTPGFLDYFIVGEHFRRFTDPGWNGDLYGNAHRYARGTIWWFATWATLPWGPVAAGLLIARLLSPRPGTIPSARDEARVFLFLLALWPLVFFTFAGNVLWTYVQPSLPPFAILLALAITRLDREKVVNLAYAALVLPVITLILVIMSRNTIWASELKTEKSLVSYVTDRTRSSEPMPTLYYVGELPFSARFYSQGHARSLNRAQLRELLVDPEALPGYIAIPTRDLHKPTLLAVNRQEPVFHNDRYSLFEPGPFAPGMALQESPAMSGKNGGYSPDITASAGALSAPRSNDDWLPSVLRLLHLQGTHGS